MLDSSGARSVHVLAAHGPEDSPPAFLRRLAGLVKYALRAYEGEIRISQLASATAQREMTVRRGLEFMAAKGQVSVDWLDGETLRLREGGEESPEAVEPALDAVKAMLAEAAAFRAFFRQAPLDAFFK
jgi:single-stranded-DNA-specific exonuclease